MQLADLQARIGETIGTYTPVGKLDGLGAYVLKPNTVRVLANRSRSHPIE